MDHVGCGERSDLLADMLDELFFQLLVPLPIRIQGDVGVNALALDRVRIPHHPGLGHRRVGDQGAFQFGRPQAVAGHVDDVIHPAGDPVATVLVPPAAVAGKVQAREPREVGLPELLGTAVDRPHHPRPGLLDAQVA